MISSNSKKIFLQGNKDLERARLLKMTNCAVTGDSVIAGLGEFEVTGVCRMLVMIGWLSDDVTFVFVFVCAAFAVFACEGVG